jgi:hypothetical protein
MFSNTNWPTKQVKQPAVIGKALYNGEQVDIIDAMPQRVVRNGKLQEIGMVLINYGGAVWVDRTMISNATWIVR